MLPAAPAVSAAVRDVAVTAADEALDALARSRAHALGLPYAPAGTHTGAALLLVQTAIRLELRDPQHNAALHVEVRPADLSPRRIGRRQPLARALGRAATVVDATAGLGHDTLLIACLGHRVIAFERCAAAAALLQDGIDRAVAERLLEAGRIVVVHADARTALPELTPPPDVIYLDPMFPPKRKQSAAVRKELRMLRALVGPDADAGELLAAGLRCAPRVVVKRPIGAPPLAPRPSAAYRGTLVRYDVYRGDAG